VGYRYDNPASGVEMPKEPIYDAHPFESWSEVERAAGVASRPRDRALILFACATGLRPQEWRALKWSDIDTASRSLRVSRTVQNGRIVEAQGKTRGSLRTVLLSKLALSALVSLPTPLRRDQLVFPGKAGDVLDLAAWRRGPWRRALGGASLAYREPYGMRDTFATLNLTDGAPLEWISEQMGHSEIDTTRKHYARWQRAREYAILDSLDASRAATGLKTDSAAEA
jgi:integrase